MIEIFDGVPFDSSRTKQLSEGESPASHRVLTIQLNGGSAELQVSTPWGWVSEKVFTEDGSWRFSAHFSNPFRVLLSDGSRAAIK
jgi:hypothetical protein